jgi:small-conductance mechanosensitive channel
MDRLRFYFTEFELFKIQDVGITVSHLVVALVAFLFALLISKVTRTVLRKRLLQRLTLDPGLEYALLRVTHYVILIIGVYIGLKTINLPLGALVGLFAVLGVGIGFGLQHVAANFVSGLILLLERPVKVGDRIEVDGVWGDVIRINLRTTVVRTPDNISIIIPNSKLVENKVINYYYSNRRIRLRLPVGVAYGSDVNKVTSILKEVAAEDRHVIESPAPEVWFMEFGDSSLNFELLCWISDAALKYDIRNRLNRRIDERFRAGGVEIPFPQHDLHLRSADTAVTMLQK